MIKTVLVLLLSIFTQLSFAISENNYEQTFTDKVLPFLSTREEFQFAGFDGMQLSGVHFKNPNEKAVILIVTGWTEPWLKYGEVFYDLYQAGYSIYSFDHRGQGLSPHLVDRNRQISFIDHFGKYVLDMNEFVENIILPTHPKKLFILAHSMGGAIALDYLTKNPFVFEKAILNAPMLKVDTRPYPIPVAFSIVALLRLVGQGESYAPGNHDYNPDASFENNNLTSSLARFNMFKDIRQMYPDVVMGGPSVTWVHESLKASRQIRLNANKLLTPTLLFQAGQDQIVKIDGQTKACNLSKSCNLIKFPDSQHEILMEKDSIRDEAMKKIMDFFQ